MAFLSLSPPPSQHHYLAPFHHILVWQNVVGLFFSIINDPSDEIIVPAVWAFGKWIEFRLLFAKTFFSPIIAVNICCRRCYNTLFTFTFTLNIWTLLDLILSIQRSLDLLIISLDHISWSYLLIYNLILISWSYHLMIIQDTFLYMNFTLLLTCIRHAFDLCLSLTIDIHSTHVAVQHAFTLHLTCFEHTFYMCLPWGQHMDISI